MRKAIYKKVRKYFASWCRLDEAGLNPDTDISLGFLGIKEMEAERFMREWAEKFGVDMTGFEFDRHFPDESILPQNYLRRWLPDEHPEFIPISIQTLADAALDKKWSADMYG